MKKSKKRKKIQRVSFEDAMKMFEKFIFRTTYDYDSSGGSEAFINESDVKSFIKKLTR